MARFPLVAHLIAGQRHGASQHAVGAHFVGERGGYPNVRGVGLVGEYLLTREPLVRRKRLGQRPRDLVRIIGPEAGVEVHRVGGAEAVADGGRFAARGGAVVVDARIGEGAGRRGHSQPGRGIGTGPANARRAPAIHHHRIDEQRAHRARRTRRGLVQFKCQGIEGHAGHAHPHQHRAGHI